jgi:hypothetical protein
MNNQTDYPIADELIRFVCGNRELCEQRDELYERILRNGWEALDIHFIPLLEKAIHVYDDECGAENAGHIHTMEPFEERYFCNSFATAFYDWKKAI